MKRLFTFLIFLSFTFSCVPDSIDSSDDGPIGINENLSQNEIDNMRFFVLNILTGGESKVLRFTDATSLQPDFPFELDEYENFLDDEFEFSAVENTLGGELRGKLEWRPGLGVNPELTDSEKLKFGSYEGTRSIEFEIGPPTSNKRTEIIEINLVYDEATLVSKGTDDSVTEKNSFGVGFPPFRVYFPSFGGVFFPSLGGVNFPSAGGVNFPSIGGVEYPSFGGVKFFAYWPYSDPNTSILELCSDIKLPSDYAEAPIGIPFLEFSEEFTFESNSVRGGSTGMTSSFANNSIYIALRERSLLQQIEGEPERIIKYDLVTKSIEENVHYNNDFVTKRIHIDNDEVFVFGGQRVNRYDSNLNGGPASTNNFEVGTTFTRAATAMVNGKIYTFGGVLSYNNQSFEQQNNSNKIFEWDMASASLKEVGTLPQPVYGAGAEIINDIAYIFGGTISFSTPPASAGIMVYDLKTGTAEYKLMRKGLYYAYAQRFQNLIYVAGQQWIFEPATEDLNGDGNIDAGDISPDAPLIDKNPFLGVYDTRNDSFTELGRDLKSPNFETIEGLAVLRNKIYVLHGQPDENAIITKWSVLSATLP